jgi:phage/plasmid-associated DNA primase
LAPEDINMLQKYLGSLIFGGNPCQNLLILKGVPGSGKSVLLDLIIGLVGVNNCVELRTEHLNQRFETARFIGKKLLFGPDVEADFLQRKESNTIKSLVGHDLLSAELKHGRESASLIGNFGVVITSNHTLKLNTKDDLEAWRRRLLVIDFPNTFTGRKIPNFSNKLLHEEGDAIFAWAVYGRMFIGKRYPKTWLNISYQESAFEGQSNCRLQ